MREAVSNNKIFIQTHLKLLGDTVKNITFHQVHRLGGNSPDARRPRPIVAKFEHYKQKELVRSWEEQTTWLVSPKNQKILERRSVLFPIRRKFMEWGSLAVIAWINYSSMGSSTLTRRPLLSSTNSWWSEFTRFCKSDHYTVPDKSLVTYPFCRNNSL